MNSRLQKTSFGWKLMTLFLDEGILLEFTYLISRSVPKQQYLKKLEVDFSIWKIVGNKGKCASQYTTDDPFLILLPGYTCITLRKSVVPYPRRKCTDIITCMKLREPDNDDSSFCSISVLPDLVIFKTTIHSHLTSHPTLSAGRKTVRACRHL